MPDNKKLSAADDGPLEHDFAVGGVLELADSQLAGLHWEITRKSVTRKRAITTVAYKLRLLRNVHITVMVNAGLLPGKTLVATQQPPHRVTSCPLTVASVAIENDKKTCACQVEIIAVSCWFGGIFQAPMPDADTDLPSTVIRNS